MYVFICQQCIVDFEIYKRYLNCVTSFLKRLSSRDDGRNARGQAQLHKNKKGSAYFLSLGHWPVQVI